MLFKTRFLFNDGASDGAGGSAAAPEIKPEFFTADEAKNLGFNDKESLVQFIAAQKEATKPDAEKQKAAELEKANFLKFSTENDLLNVDEYKSYEDVKSKPDRDLVFAEFSKEFKEDNPEIEDEDFEEAVENAFEAQFKLNSKNEKEKTRGEAKLKKEAAQLRSPFQSKYDTAITRFGDFNNASKNYPAFDKFVDEIISESIPEKLTIKISDGEGDKKTEIPVEIEIPKDQLDEAKKLFKTPKYFKDFLNGEKKAELKAAIAQKINGYIKANNFDAAVNKSFTTAAGVYLKKGSTAGAENQFGLQAGGAAVIEMNPKTLVEANEKRAAQRRNR